MSNCNRCDINPEKKCSCKNTSNSTIEAVGEVAGATGDYLVFSGALNMIGDAASVAGDCIGAVGSAAGECIAAILD